METLYVSPVSELFCFTESVKMTWMVEIMSHDNNDGTVTWAVLFRKIYFDFAYNWKRMLFQHQMFQILIQATRKNV